MRTAESFPQFTSFDLASVIFAPGFTITGTEINVSRLQIASVIATLNTVVALTQALGLATFGLEKPDAGCHEYEVPPAALKCTESCLQIEVSSDSATKETGMFLTNLNESVYCIPQRFCATTV